MWNFPQFSLPDKSGSPLLDKSGIPFPDKSGIPFPDKSYRYDWAKDQSRDSRAREWEWDFRK